MVRVAITILEQAREKHDSDCPKICCADQNRPVICECRAYDANLGLNQTIDHLDEMIEQSE
ncbi:hypothetical protein ACFLZ9_01640 [Patescibacteria group bacterium]